MQPSFVWLLLVVGFLVLEAVTAGLVSVWFAIGALFAFLTSLITSSLTVQIIVFFVISIALILATLPLAKKYRSNKSLKTNAQRNIGLTGTVVVEISPQMPGRVKVDGVDWTAKSNTVLKVGELCVVQSLESATVIVVPANSEQTV